VAPFRRTQFFVLAACLLRDSLLRATPLQNHFRRNAVDAAPENSTRHYLIRPNSKGTFTHGTRFVKGANKLRWANRRVSRPQLVLTDKQLNEVVNITRGTPRSVGIYTMSAVTGLQAYSAIARNYRATVPYRLLSSRVAKSSTRGPKGCCRRLLSWVPGF
jgi:hypothetical protein